MQAGGRAHGRRGAGWRRSARGALALASTLLPAALAPAQAPAPAVVDTGKPVRVLAVDVEARTLEVAGAGGATGLFHVEPAAPIVSGPRKLSLGDLRPGFTLVLDEEERWGRRVVTFVEVLEAPEPAAPAEPLD